MRGRRGLAAAGGWAIILALGTPGLAGDDATPVAVGVRLSQDSDGARLVFDLSRPVEARVHALSAPDRIVIDLPEVNFRLDPTAGRSGAAGEGGVIKAFRFGLLAPGKSRIVIDLARPACPAEVGSKPIIDGTLASRLRIELRPCEAAAFATLSQATAQLAPPPGPSAAFPLPLIVLDPGHGGADGGARGVGGALEKTLVFEFCIELKRQLEGTGRYRIMMTRNADEYVDLDDRVEMARDANAALFISVHADTLSDAADVSGSTVYTAAERASDAEAARIAASENAAGQKPGGERKPQDDPAVADILFDLKRRETRTYAHIFSRGTRGESAPRRPAEPQSGTLCGVRCAQGPGISVGLG